MELRIWMNKIGGNSFSFQMAWPENVNVPKTNSYRKSSSPVSVCIRASTHIRWLKQIEHFSFCAAGREEEEERRGWWSTMDSEGVKRVAVHAGDSLRFYFFYFIFFIQLTKGVTKMYLSHIQFIFRELPSISELISMRTVSGPRAKSTPSQGADWS